MTPAFTTPQRVRIGVLAGLVPLLIASAGIVAMVSWTDLSSSVIIHWGPNGPDAYGPPWIFAAIVATSVIVFSVIVAASVANLPAPRERAWQPRFLVAMSVAFSTILTISLIGSLAIQRGGAATRDLSPLPPLLLGFGAAIVLGLVTYLLAPKPRIAEREIAPDHALELANDERVLWVQSATIGRGAFWSLVGALLLVVGAAVLVVFLGAGNAIVILVAAALVVLAVFTTFYWTIRIDSSGVVARGVLGVPTFRVPAGEIAGASVIDVAAIAEYGGWGIRLGAAKPAIVLQSGPALEVRRIDGSKLVVTVTDAATAAALINGLVARNAASRPS